MTTFRPQKSYQLVPVIIGIICSGIPVWLGYWSQQPTLIGIGSVYTISMLMLLGGVLHECKMLEVVFTHDALIWNTTVFQKRYFTISFADVEKIILREQFTWFSKKPKVVDLKIITRKNQHRNTTVIDGFFFKNAALELEEALDSHLKHLQKRVSKRSQFPKFGASQYLIIYSLISDKESSQHCELENADVSS